MIEVLAALAVAVVAALAGYFKGRSSAKERDQKVYQETMGRISNAGNDVDSLDRDSLDDRLRKNL